MTPPLKQIAWSVDGKEKMRKTRKQVWHCQSSQKKLNWDMKPQINTAKSNFILRNIWVAQHALQERKHEENLVFPKALRLVKPNSASHFRLD